MVWRQKPQSWSSQANPGLVLQTAPPSQRAHLCLIEPGHFQRNAIGKTLTFEKVKQVHLRRIFSPWCLHPWTHTCCSASESSSAAWSASLPGPGVSSGTDEPCRPSPWCPPGAPRQKCSAAHPCSAEHTCVTVCCVFAVLRKSKITCKVPQHEAPPVQPVSWSCCGFVTTGPEPSLPWRSCHLWPTSQKPRLLGQKHTHQAGHFHLTISTTALNRLTVLPFCIKLYKYRMAGLTKTC